MPSLILLIPVALILVAVAVLVYLWAVGSGQYQDLDREASRILFDEDAEPAASKPSKAAPEHD